MLPGQEQDIELARVATAFGVLMIERLSGRKEVFHASGTRAWRNPTVEELQERSRHFTQLASKKGCDAAARACAQRLAEICAAWEANNAEAWPLARDNVPGPPLWPGTNCRGGRSQRL
eukprot:g21265.t1